MSHVAMEQKVCHICGNTYNTNAILLHKRLGNITNPITGYGTCQECQKLKNDGYIALVVVDNQGSSKVLKPDEAHRTGEIIHMRKSAFANIFNIPAGDHDMMFIDPDAAEKLKSLIPGS